MMNDVERQKSCGTGSFSQVSARSAPATLALPGKASASLGGRDDWVSSNSGVSLATRGEPPFRAMRQSEVSAQDDQITTKRVWGATRFPAIAER